MLLCACCRSELFLREIAFVQAHCNCTVSLHLLDPPPGVANGETLLEKNIPFLVPSIFQRLFLYIQVQTAAKLANLIVV